MLLQQSSQLATKGRSHNARALRNLPLHQQTLRCVLQDLRGLVGKQRGTAPNEWIGLRENFNRKALYFMGNL